MKGLKEVDLYPPVAEFLIARGYTLRSEVEGSDVVALQGDELVIVELKLNFSIDLLLQATERQKSADTVYVAIVRPASGMHGSRWRRIVHLVRRLELGLILVSFSTPRPLVEIAVHPESFSPKRSHQKRRAIIREARGRSDDFNAGGAVRRKLVTAYRENAIQIAYYLKLNGPLSRQELVDRGCGTRTKAILSHNVYGWFMRVSRGVYSLSERGQEELREYSNVTALFEKADAGNSL
jgi:hypothetical protein